MPFCESCGAEFKTGARFCEDCGAALTDQAPSSAREKSRSPGTVKTAVGHPDQGDLAPAPPKNVALATIASLLCPGLGQVYNGSTVLGVVILVGTVSGLYLIGFPGFIFWAYGVFNSFETAGRMNSGQKTPVPHNPTHIVIFVIGAAIASLVLGYLLTASGRSLFG